MGQARHRSPAAQEGLQGRPGQLPSLGHGAAAEHAVQPGHAGSLGRHASCVPCVL